MSTLHVLRELVEFGAWKRTVLALDAVLFLILVTAAWSGASAMILLGALLVAVILWFKGFVRYRRVRKVFATLGQAVKDLAKTHRLTRRQLKTVILVGTFLVALIIVNQLRLALPGKGHGISIPLDAFSFNFAGFNAEGAGIANTISYGLLAGLLFLTWYRLWQGVKPVRQDWRGQTYWASVGAFVLLPIIFIILMATVAPKLADPKTADQTTIEASSRANVAFSKLWLGLTQTGMALALCTAVALPFFGAPPPAAVPTTATVTPPAPAAPAPVAYVPYGSGPRTR